MILQKRRDFPRYEYAKMKFEEKGVNKTTGMVTDIYLQMGANLVVLWYPIMIIASDKRQGLGIFEYVGFLMWITFYCFESVADFQKNGFIRDKSHPKTDVCEVGLWQYSRHPNYFGQWMQWDSIAFLAFACVIHQIMAGDKSLDRPPVAITMAIFNLLTLSYSFHFCLTKWTGAVPAEYFSVKKRPGYKDYQQ